ncbi:MAG: hypothetical protein K9K86_04215 [Pseudomonadales bacterium]|nr:hypothetical protein [Pseudomonadales bacterium]
MSMRPNNSVGICKLCQKEAELKNSHIIPEFFYRRLYDDKHRFNVVPLDPTENARYEQKGLREHLLCNDCEQQFSKYEKYTRGIFYGGKSILIGRGNPIRISRVDYQRFKLFQLSLIFRAALSKLPFFYSVKLGHHEERIRKMLLKEDPGDETDYPCMVIVFLRDKNVPMDDFIHPPDRLKLYGHTLYRMVLGGGFWIWIISSHSRQFPRLDFILKKDGTFQIPLRKAEDSQFFKDIAQKMRKVKSHDSISMVRTNLG